MYVPTSFVSKFNFQQKRASFFKYFGFLSNLNANKNSRKNMNKYFRRYVDGKFNS